MNTTRLAHLIAGFAAILALFGAVGTAGSALAAPQTEPGDLLDPRTYDPASRAFLTLHATGVQRYACQANGSWLFSDPVADLYAPNSTGKPTGSHYLNFATGRPVWKFKDGSTVEAARRVTASGGAGIFWLGQAAAAAQASWTWSVSSGVGFRACPARYLAAMRIRRSLLIMSRAGNVRNSFVSDIESSSPSV